MKPATATPDDALRVDRLRALQVLDTEPESEFDALVEAASLVCGTPIALVSLVDEHRQWFKANVGLPGATETPRDVSFCGHAIHQDGLFEVPNALEDSRFFDNPLVTGDPGIRFYAGMPLRLQSGEKVGTLCVIDRSPRTLSSSQRDIIVHLGHAVARALELRESHVRIDHERKKLQNVLAATGAGSWVWNVQTNYFEYDKQLDNILADERRVGTMDELLQHLHPEDLEPLNHAYMAHVRGETTRYDMRVRIAHPGQDWTWVRASGQISSRTASGAPEWVYGSFLDITTDVKNREVIALAKERLDLAADAGSLGIWDIDLLSNTYAWDDRMYQHYGLDPSAKIAPETVWFKLVHPDDLAQVVAETKSAIASGGRSVSEFRIIRQDGSMHHMRSCAIAVRGSGDKVARITGINQDITEAKRFAAELREARRVADEANVAKGQFLANMSHEIRTPLNAIIGLSELVMRTELTTRQRHYLENISAAGHSLLSVINDVLDFSKIESGKFDVENVDFTLSDVLDRLASMTGLRAQEKGLELLYAISPDVPKVLIGDAGRLGQVLLNLVSNAIKFSASGEIVLTGRREMQQGNPVRLRFEVQDTGIGLSAEQAVRLFQPFVQADASTSRQFGGTGLGLVISKKLVELMGGNIHVESTQGQGSRFIFTVQMGQPDTAPADLPTIAWRADFSRLRVLVIDDNQSARQILVDTLQSLGLYAVAVERGDLGIDELAAAQRAGQAYDLAIIDRQMPMLDGVETIRRIRADERIAKTLATVMLTAFGAEELRAAAFGVHLDAILEKPVHPEKLFRLITQILPAGMAIQSSAGLVERSKQRMNGQEPYLTGARVLLVEDNKLNQEVATELLKATGMTVALAEDGF